ncbi:MAG: type II toxin-antitoxin system HicA family toxin [Candidatus Dormibacteraeota bacterium]|nr:type II toxin-antitoxin system HicA family toxin [Candidatus Dormibacteraeota bacterium]
MPRLPRMTSQELIRHLQRAGWRVVRHPGSHAILRHPSRAGRLVVPVHAGNIIKPKIMARMLDKAGIARHLAREME